MDRDSRFFDHPKPVMAHESRLPAAWTRLTAPDELLFGDGSDRIAAEDAVTADEAGLTVA
jgi:hypothetical protein